MYYDSNGNLAYGGSAGNLIYTHDAQNRLTATQGSGNNASLSYDARNRCVKRVVPFTTGSGQTTTYLVWDCWTLLAEYTMASGYDGSSYVNVPLAEARRYVAGAGVDEMLLAIAPTAAQTVHHLHDGLGSVTALTDATGAVVERATYDVFGKVTLTNAGGTVLTASAYGNRFLFTGREWLAELNVYDYRNRYYSAGLGRFLETDPINYAAGDVNLYRYVGNDPALLIDVFGLQPADQRFGLTDKFWDWYHKNVKQEGDRDLKKPEAEEKCKEWEEKGKPSGDNKGKNRGKERGKKRGHDDDDDLPPPYTPPLSEPFSLPYIPPPTPQQKAVVTGGALTTIAIIIMLLLAPVGA